MKKSKKILSLVLPLAMLIGLLSVSAFAVMDNDHDRISVGAGSALSVQWNPDYENLGEIVSSNSDYYPASFDFYVDTATSIEMTGGATHRAVEETVGGTRYQVTLGQTAGTITVRLAQSAQPNDTYVLSFSAPHGAAPGGATPSAFNKYLPLGQYANGSAWGSPYSDGTVLTGTTPKIVGGYSSTGVSLGAAGGYVQYEFNTMIEDNPANPYGVDFVVYGNAFSGNPEAASVKVSDDGTNWYELAGSLYYDSTVTKRNATVSYEKRSDGIYYTLDGATWTKLTGTTAWWPEYEAEGYGSVYGGNESGVLWSTDYNTITFSGVTLVRDTDTTNDYQFGYADIHANGSNYGAAANPYTITNAQSGGDGFDLAWAVQSDGTPAHLGAVKYVRVYTSAAMKADGSGVFTTPSIFGETSAEVCGIFVASGTTGSVGTTDLELYADGAELPTATNHNSATPISAGIYDIFSSEENVFVNGTKVIASGADGYRINVAPGAQVQIITQSDKAAAYITLLVGE